MAITRHVAIIEPARWSALSPAEQQQYDAHYSTWTAYEAARARDLVAANESEIVDVYAFTGDYVLDSTGAGTDNGSFGPDNYNVWKTDASHTLTIRGAPSDVAAGNKPVIRNRDLYYPVLTQVPYVAFEDLVIKNEHFAYSVRILLVNTRPTVSSTVGPVLLNRCVVWNYSNYSGNSCVTVNDARLLVHSCLFYSGHAIDVTGTSPGPITDPANMSWGIICSADHSTHKTFVDLVNVTFWKCDVGIYFDQASPYVFVRQTNCVYVNNQIDNARFNFFAGPTLTPNTAADGGNCATTRTIQDDPAIQFLNLPTSDFVDVAADNYHLVHNATIKDRGRSNVVLFDTYYAYVLGVDIDSQPRDATWDIGADEYVPVVVSNSIGFSWNSNVLATSAVDFAWVANSQVSQSTDFAWLSTVIIHVYLVNFWSTLVAITTTFLIPWVTFSHASALSQLSWTAFQNVASFLSLAWYALGQVATAFDFSWATHERRSQTFDLSWLTLNEVTPQSAVLSWTSYQLAPGSSDLLWTVVGTTRASADLNWYVRAVISTGYNLPWYVLKTASPSALDLSWQLRSIAAGSLESRWWAFEQSGPASIVVDWQAFSLASASLEILWGVIGSTAAAADLPWRAYATANQNTQLRWVAYRGGAAAVDLPWTVFPRKAVKVVIVV